MENKNIISIKLYWSEYATRPSCEAFMDPKNYFNSKIERFLAETR